MEPESSAVEEGADISTPNGGLPSSKTGGDTSVHVRL